MEIKMFLFLLKNYNLLIGDIPESLGLLVLGVALIALTIGIRWFMNDSEEKDHSEENLEKITGNNNQ